MKHSAPPTLRVPSPSLPARPDGNHRGKRLWRALDELAPGWDRAALPGEEGPADVPAFGEFRRRSLLKVMAASMALSGLTACDMEADEEALPYVETPEFTIPGKAVWYATAVTLGGYAQAVLGKTYDGRPVKLEGNPDHPVQQGASDPFLQAAVLDLYDPDRSQAPRQYGRAASWGDYEHTQLELRQALDRRRGKGLRLLLPASSSPTLARQLADLGARWPEARWHRCEPLLEKSRLGALQAAFGTPCELQFRLEQAAAIVCLDDDLLGPGPHQAPRAAGWSRRRQAAQRGEAESRLFVCSPAPTITAALAENRLIAAPGRIQALTFALARALGIELALPGGLTGAELDWINSSADALKANPGAALVTAGPHQPEGLQALVLEMNRRLGALGAVAPVTRPVLLQPPDGLGSFETLLEDMENGEVDTLFILGANPAYASPQPERFGAALKHVSFTVHAGLHYDETASLSAWHLPLQHELESWGDCRASDGTVSIQQPLVKPFYDVRSLHGLLDLLLGGRRPGRAIVQQTWRAAWGSRFERQWDATLVNGFVEGSAAQALRYDAGQAFTPPTPAPRAPAPEGSVTALIRPDPTVWDGRFANNAWLQETPKPLIKTTWDNVVQISPGLATARGLANGDEVSLKAGGQQVTGAVWITPGLEAESIVLTLGYGRRRSGRVAEGCGFDVYPLLAAAAQSGWQVDGVMLEPTGNSRLIATTQLHQAMDGYDFVRTVASGEEAVERKTAPGREHPPSFYQPHPVTSPAWGMSIDLDLCIGCNACVVACMSENNVPVVGRELVAQGREMHWLRVDHYLEGPPEAPRSYFQPVPCMHCEQAPCEMGCPVNATVHSTEGLNVQVYNRCIGTRTCSSFCPYKVRRFNWYDYTSDDPESVQALRNPDVTVRDRGIMEKCSYCVQRINEARISAEVDGRPLADGDILTACQQACPTQAIVFGNVADKDSAVSRRKAGSRDYSLLEEVNTRPRTTYLARIEPAVADIVPAGRAGIGKGDRT